MRLLWKASNCAASPRLASSPSSHGRKCPSVYAAQCRSTPGQRAGAIGKSLGATKCVQIRPEEDFWRPLFEWTKSEQPSLLSLLSHAKQGLEGRESAKLEDFEDEDEPEEHRSRLKSILEEATDFFSTEFSYDDYIQKMTQNQSELYVATDGFIPVSAGRDTDRPTLETILARNTFEMGAGLSSGFLRRIDLPDIGFASVMGGRAVEETLASLFPLGPFRKPPSRWYIFTGTTPKDVGYQGHLLPDLLFRQPELLANTNDWLSRLDIGYELTVRSLGGASSDLFELRLLDKRRQPAVEVGLSDVGFGISQVLPLIVQSLAASDQIITIEQPEVHIHPDFKLTLPIYSSKRRKNLGEISSSLRPTASTWRCGFSGAYEKGGRMA